MFLTRRRPSHIVAAVTLVVLSLIADALPAVAQTDAPPPDLTSRNRLDLHAEQAVGLRVLLAPDGVKFRLCPRDGRKGRKSCVRLTPLNPTRNDQGTYRTQVLVPRYLPGQDCAAQRRACEIRSYAATGGAFDRITVDFAPPAICTLDQSVGSRRPPRAGIAAIEAALAAPGLAAVTTGVSIHIEGYGEVVGRNADSRLVPASNEKLFTAIGAHRLLPIDHGFTTIVGESAGDLALVAGGDPTLRRFGTHSSGTLAQRVADASSVTHYDRLVIDATRYTNPTTAVGWPDWTVPRYAGPLSAFTVDDNRWRKDDTYVANPALGNGQQFAAALAEVGIEVDEVVAATDSVRLDTELARLGSPTTRSLLDSMLRYSDNEIADNLMMEIGRVAADNGTLATGVDAINRSLLQLCPALTGAARDGSGLSYQNFRSPREWQQILRAVKSEPWFGEFKSALPVAGESGTLRRRFDDPSTVGNVTAKTGTLFGSRALSGYATTAGGRAMTFSIIVNGDNDPVDRALSALDDVIVAAVNIDQ